MNNKRAAAPHLFTLTNLFFGFMSLIFTADGRYLGAVWFIVFAAICDAVDGMAARLTKTHSLFGKELDSLADLVSFGVAPAFLVYTTNFSGNGLWGAVFCFIFVLAGIFRLARYNIESSGYKRRMYKGLPIPSAALTLTTSLLFTNFHQETVHMPSMMMALILGLSALMVSTFEYDALPEPVFRRDIRRNIRFIIFIIALAFMLSNPGKWLFIWFAIYILFYPARSILHKLREGNKEDIEIPIDKKARL